MPGFFLFYFCGYDLLITKQITSLTSLPSSYMAPRRACFFPHKFVKQYISINLLAFLLFYTNFFVVVNNHFSGRHKLKLRTAILVPILAFFGANRRKHLALQHLNVGSN